MCILQPHFVSLLCFISSFEVEGPQSWLVNGEYERPPRASGLLFCGVCARLFMSGCPDRSGRMFAVRLCSVWSDKRVLRRARGPSPRWLRPLSCERANPLRTPAARRPCWPSLIDDRSLTLHTGPALHPCKCVSQIRFAECVRHPGAEDGGP